MVESPKSLELYNERVGQVKMDRCRQCVSAKAWWSAKILDWILHLETEVEAALDHWQTERLARGTYPFTKQWEGCSFASLQSCA
jgi:hypothetical protein